MARDYGSPYYHVHRADLHRLLFDLVADTHAVVLRLNSTVTHLDPNGGDTGGPSVTLSTGEIVHGDLIIGADGVKSMIREVRRSCALVPPVLIPVTWVFHQIVIGRPDAPTPTGDAAYRALIPCSELEKDPDLRSFIETPEMTAWMAPRRHLMAYCIVRAKEKLAQSQLTPSPPPACQAGIQRRAHSPRRRLCRVMDGRGVRRKDAP